MAMSIINNICRSFISFFWSRFIAPPTITNTKRVQIPVKIRNMTWAAYHGNNKRGVCYACGKNIDCENWHCSHVISDNANGIINVSNLRTCCPHCNLSCGKQNLYAFIRDKNLKGPGSRNVNAYMRNNPDQINSSR